VSLLGLLLVVRSMDLWIKVKENVEALEMKLKIEEASW
jgi:hypothetical protein